MENLYNEDNLYNEICIIETNHWLACKLKEFTEEDYVKNIITSVSDRTYEILINQKTTLEKIEEILNGVKDWNIN